MVHRLVALLLPLLLAGASSPTLAQDLASRAERVMGRLGLEADPTVEALLGAAYVRVPCAGVELSMERAFAGTAEGGARVVEVATGILQMQKALLAWSPCPAKRAKELAKAIDNQCKWLQRTKGKAWVRALEKGTAGDLPTLLGWKPDLVEEARMLEAAFASGEPWGLARGSAPVQVIVAADRDEFVDLLSLAGRIDPTAQSSLWTRESPGWSHFFVLEVRVWSMLHVDGSRMDREDRPTLTRQQLEQLAVTTLLEHWSQGHLPAALIAGLALEAVVATEGECDTRLDGDLRPRASQAWETFVPGGLSEGGILPAMPATTRWREFAGSDHFLPELRASQADGATDEKRAGGGDHYFRILSDGGTKHMTVAAPFLGESALGREIPAPYQGDWLEFTRAYRAAFLFWLRTEAGKNERDSLERFGRLLAALMSAPEPGALEAAWPEHFDGRPLSTSSLEGESLEKRFLSWLRRQRG